MKVHIPYFEVVLEFPVTTILAETKTHTTLIYMAWGMLSETKVPNEWVKK